MWQSFNANLNGWDCLVICLDNRDIMTGLTSFSNVFSLKLIKVHFFVPKSTLRGGPQAMNYTMKFVWIGKHFRERLKEPTRTQNYSLNKSPLRHFASKINSPKYSASKFYFTFMKYLAKNVLWCISEIWKYGLCVYRNICLLIHVKDI